METSNITHNIDFTVNKETFRITFHSPWIGDDERLKHAANILATEGLMERKLEALFQVFGPAVWQFKIGKVTTSVEPL